MGSACDLVFREGARGRVTAVGEMNLRESQRGIRRSVADQSSCTERRDRAGVIVQCESGPASQIASVRIIWPEL